MHMQEWPSPPDNFLRYGKASRIYSNQYKYYEYSPHSERLRDDARGKAAHVLNPRNSVDRHTIFVAPPAGSELFIILPSIELWIRLALAPGGGMIPGGTCASPTRACHA